MDIKRICEIAILAGNAILEIYEQDFDVEFKDDDSPLTMADKKANDIIINELNKFYPEIPIISEEIKNLDYQVRKDWSRCWLVDPLDGTKEFIKKNGEFTVNIALIETGRPILGVVHVPVEAKTYFGVKDDGAYLSIGGTTEQIKTRHHDNGSIIIVGSRSHTNELTAQFVEEKKRNYEKVDFLSAGSSLKFCLIAEGKADLYPRFGPTMEWDTAAGQAVVEAAGGKVLRYPEMTMLDYNKENLLNPFFMVQSN